MQRAKGQEPGAVQFFAEMSALAAHTLSMQSRLRHALENGEFVAHYQPKLHLPTNRIVGIEALVRWQDPERGLVPPGAFIAVAEEYGLIDSTS